MNTDNLPKFKYHPNVYDCGVVEFGQGTCNCCGKETDAYVRSMYTREDVDCICMECVASGAAAEKFDGEFIQDADPVDNDEAREELFCRTPGYVSWQGENWAACCNDYCEYIGAVGTEELEELGDHLKAEHGFVINPLRTVFYGLCTECLKQKEDEDE